MKFLEIEILLLFIQFFYTNEIRQKFQNNYLNKSTLIPNKTAVPLTSTTNNNKCNKGEFIYNNTCLKKCRDNYFADNIKHKCLPSSQRPVSILAYSKYSCLNSCGQFFSECSCNISCLQEGNCCSDFYPFCMYNNTKYKLRNEKCGPGLYYFNNTCKESCPFGYKANKMKMICDDINYLGLSFYWVFPSKQSCENKCGLNSNGDCSCSYDCIRNGNCCDDIDEYCSKELKQSNYKLCKKYNENNLCIECIENAAYEEGICRCFPEFEYDFVVEGCVEKYKPINLIKTQEIMNKTVEDLVLEVIKQSKGIGNKNSNNSSLNNNPINLYMNGDISINILANNTNSTLSTHKVNNKDSYNSAKMIHK